MWRDLAVPFQNRAVPRAQARRRRCVAGSLRNVVAQATKSERILKRRGLLLVDRVLPVRAELLEIADLLDRNYEADPSVVDQLYRLLTDGCESPLFNRRVHASELRAALFSARCRLTGTDPEDLTDSGEIDDAERSKISWLHGEIGAWR